MLVKTANCEKALVLPYLPTMSMAAYLRLVISPAFGLPCVGDTVQAKVHTADLRVVFNNECRDRLMDELLSEDSVLIISHWDEGDPSTKRSLVDNARITRG